MQLNFPTFEQQHLQSFRICACFSLADTPLSKQIAVPAYKPTWRETRFESRAKGAARIRVRAGHKKRPSDPNQPEGYMELECAIESLFPPSRRNEGLSSNAEEVKELWGLFVPQKTAWICCEGLFYIPQDKIPGRGIVGLMLDLSASVGKASVNLTGAAFDVQGREPYETVRWKRRATPEKEPPDRPELEVVITACPAGDGIIGVPEEVATVLSAGIEELILETGK
jgi:hypothetical protein